MNLIDAFAAGQVSRFPVKPDKDVESTLSRIFFFDDLVCKVYKYESSFIGDFTNEKFRSDFYQKDFSWNRTMSPEIYRSLEVIDIDGVTDHYILMNKVAAEKNLTELAIDRQLNLDDLESAGRKMADRLSQLNEGQKNDLQKQFSRSWLDLLLEGYEDLRNWAYDVDYFMPRDQTDRVVDTLIAQTKETDYIINFPSKQLGVLIDNHADNLLLIDGQLILLDILPPKDNWRVGDPFLNACRPATDLAALHSEEAAELFRQGYAEINPTADADVRRLYEIRSAWIRAGYFAMLKKSDLAQLYVRFTLKKLAEL